MTSVEAWLDNTPERGEATRLVLRLDPPDVGVITVALRRDPNGLHVTVVSDNPLTAAQTQTLRESAQAAAAAAGEDLAGFDSSTSDGAADRSDRADQWDRNQRVRLAGPWAAPDAGTSTAQLPTPTQPRVLWL